MNHVLFLDLILQLQVQPYDPLEVSVGDTVTFTWSGTHGLTMIPSGQCPVLFTGPDVTTLVDVSSGGSYEWKAMEPGTYWFACQVPGHCLAGQVIKITVVE